MFETPWLFQMHLFALCIGSVEEVSPLAFLDQYDAIIMFFTVVFSDMFTDA